MNDDSLSSETPWPACGDLADLDGVSIFEARQKNGSKHSMDNGESKSAGEAEAPDNETYETSVDLQECDRCGAWFSGETCERENCPD